MITGYMAGGRRLDDAASQQALADLAWIDIEAPTPADEALIAAELGLRIPARADMAEIEPSSRIRFADGALYLTAQVLASREERDFDIAPVTFLLTSRQLLSIHDHRPGSFAFFAGKATRHDGVAEGGVATFLGLVEAIVDRLADILEAEARAHDLLSRRIFDGRNEGGRTEALQDVLGQIGRAEDLNGNIGESLSTILRLLRFLARPAPEGARALLEGMDAARLDSLTTDVHFLREETETQSVKIMFLLDATLGAISIRQAEIVKLFSVVAFVFLPPTLIASIYGMNFDVMPELHFPWAYPAALVAMVVSAVVPWLIFRWKKWL